MRRSLLTVSVAALAAGICCASPRVALTHFEKDLQALAKLPAPLALPEGSFVQRLAKKRAQKEDLEAACAQLEQEVAQVGTEVAQIEQHIVGVEQSIRDIEAETEQRREVTQALVVQGQIAREDF